MLNALKKKEYRDKPTTFRDWNYLCDYISKHNCTILAEVIAVANKIERELYDVESMLHVQEHFETLQLQPKSEPSLKLVYTFIENAILFFKSKNKSNAYEEKPMMKQNNRVNERSITNRKSFHQHSKSKTSESSIGLKKGSIYISQIEEQTEKKYPTQSHKVIKIKPVKTIDSQSNRLSVVNLPHSKAELSGKIFKSCNVFEGFMYQHSSKFNE